ncbi:MAG: PRC-barrel domain-containing protein [Paracoccus sp. (in: a-proteobacteria)]|uniref:PRC-barrel domain-containing protein n=1 Tax=Paracoccus sp. TaxID=267 RepID=UPI0039E6D7E7
MKPLVIAATALALAAPAYAQVAAPAATPEQSAQTAADSAETAAENAIQAAEQVADQAAEQVGAVAEQVAADVGAATDQAADAPAAVTPPDVNAPAISEADPGQLGSWITSRRIWTTNQPSSIEWSAPQLEKRPAEWQDIAKVNDVVLDESGSQVVGYIADIGGFLGIGAKKVLLGVDAIHLVTVGNDTFFATNYTKQELQALPDFDEKIVRK